MHLSAAVNKKEAKENARKKMLGNNVFKTLTNSANEN